MIDVKVYNLGGFEQRGNSYKQSFCLGRYDRKYLALYSAASEPE